MTISIIPGVPTATHISAILSGYSWTGTGITFGFADSATDFYNDPVYSGYSEPNGFVALSTAGQNTVRAAAGQWAGLMNLGLTETTAHPDMNVGGSSYNVSTSQAYYPAAPGAAARDMQGDLWFGTASFNSAYYGSAPIKSGSYLAATAMHEMGHALGLKHPHQANLGTGGITATLDLAYDGLENSVMSYRSYLGGPTSFYTVKDGHYPQTLMVLDIAAIQQLYGADFTTQSGNTVYSFSPTTGEMSINGVGTGAPEANVVFRTLWDGGGTDTIDLSTYATDLNINLNPGVGSKFDTDTGLAQRAQLDKSTTAPVFAANNFYMSMLSNGDTRSLIENATGGSGDDILTGNTAKNVLRGGAGIDTIYGDAGIDTLYGDAGADTLSGGTGNDTLYGGTDADALFGDVGNDTLRGDAGNDILTGGAGRDALYGGADADVFVFAPGDQASSQYDTVKDFEIGVDALDFSAFVGTDHVTDFALADTSSGLQISVFAGQLVYLAGIDQADVAASPDAFGW